MISLEKSAGNTPFGAATDRDATRSIWYTISAFGAVFALSIAYGFQWKIEPAGLFTYFLMFSIAFFAFLLSAFASALAPLPAPALSGRMAEGIVYLLACLSLLLSAYFYSAYLPHVELFYMLTAALLLVRIVAKSTAHVLLAVAGSAVIGYVGLQMENAATMFTIIEAACSDALIGKNPWIEGYAYISPDLPFYYLPLLPVPYCGAVLIGLDFQVLNLLVYFLLMAVTLYLMRPWRGVGAEYLVIVGFLLSPLFPLMISTVHLWVYWLTLILFTYCFLGKRYLAAAILMGVLLATRQMTLLIGLPLLIYMLKDLGVRRCLGYLAVAIAVYAVVMVPVILATPGYIDLVYLDLPGARKGGNPLTRNPFDQISLSGIFFRLGVGSVLTALQIGVCLGAGLVILLWKRVTAYQAMMVTALGYLLAVSLSSFLLRYFYVGGLLMMLYSVACQSHTVSKTGVAAAE